MKAVILAGGASSRFWPLNQRHKSLFKIMDRPIIFYTILALKKAGIKKIIIVEGKKKDIEKELKNYPISGVSLKFIVQKKPKGMGDALWQAKDFVSKKFLVLNAERVDVDEIIKGWKGKVSSSKGIIAGQETENPSLFGIMKLKVERIVEIVEKPKKEKAPSKIKVVGVYPVSYTHLTLPTTERV